MTTDFIPSSVYNIKEAIVGYSRYYFFCAEPGAYQCTTMVYSLLQQEGKSVQWVGDGWFLESHPPEESILTIDEFKDNARKHLTGDVCVVLGSYGGYPITQNMIQFCHHYNLFSFFLFDHWCNLELHFLDQTNQVLHLPTAIGAVDDVGKNALWDALQPYHPPENYERNIVIVGQPSIEKTVYLIQHVPGTAVSAFRTRVHAEDKELLVYLMEPNCEDFGLEPYDTDYLGYTEYSVLDTILTSVKQENQVLVIKPHPRTTMETLTAFLQNYSELTLQDCLVVTNEPLELIIAAADMVLGITTVVLIMALKTGKPIQSFQPNRTARAMKLTHIYLEQHLHS